MKATTSLRISDPVPSGALYPVRSRCRITTDINVRRASLSWSRLPERCRSSPRSQMPCRSAFSRVIFTWIKGRRACWTVQSSVCHVVACPSFAAVLILTAMPRFIYGTNVTPDPLRPCNIGVSLCRPLPLLRYITSLVFLAKKAS